MHFCNSLRVKTVDFVHAFVCESKLLKVKHILCVLSYILYVLKSMTDLAAYSTVFQPP